jgi:hypothetical protein
VGKSAEVCYAFETQCIINTVVSNPGLNHRPSNLESLALKVHHKSAVKAVVKGNAPDDVEEDASATGCSSFKFRNSWHLLRMFVNDQGGLQTYEMLRAQGIMFSKTSYTNCENGLHTADNVEFKCRANGFSIQLRRPFLCVVNYSTDYIGS